MDTLHQHRKNIINSFGVVKYDIAKLQMAIDTLKYQHEQLVSKLNIAEQRERELHKQIRTLVEKKAHSRRRRKPSIVVVS